MLKTRLILLAAIILSFSQVNGNEKPLTHHAPSKTSNDRHDGPPPHHGGPLLGEILHFSEELQLSEDQVKRIRELNQTYRNKISVVEEKLEQEYITLHQKLSEEHVNLSEIRALLDRISPLRNDLLIYRIEHRLEIDKILTEEQQIIYREFSQSYR